ncbi:hypothetical protein BH09PLA1_BH09PLA1_25410 [soil metagenome]
MAKRVVVKQVGEFGEILTQRAQGIATFTPQEIAHVYIKLDFKPESENAGNADDAKGFLRSVARAAIAAHQIAKQYDGVLLEVQGSTLHAGLRSQQQFAASAMDNANAFVGDLHAAYKILFSDKQKRVQGWRMTVDAGKTLIVAGRGVHGDDSLVSLGNAANRPAKHLYSQLELAERDRDLKVFHVGVRQPQNGRWIHEHLDRATPRLLKEARAIAEDASRAEPRLHFDGGWKRVTARALPLGPAGSPASPSPDRPATHFGWVMKTDLDGFTARVQECLDRNEKLQELAEQFYCIMDTAADFTEAQKEELAQLPWAGDNFTAAVVFPTRDAYDAAIPKRLVELALDFEKEMAQVALDCGTGGWAYGIAGGEVHGSAAGNVFLAGVEIDGRRFLVGVGEGFGRSTDAFGHIDPKAQQMVVYTPDWERMYKPYKDRFEPAVTARTKGQSTLFHSAKADPLNRVRANEASATTFTTIDFPREEPRRIPTKQHYD